MGFSTTCWLASASFWLLVVVTPWAALPAAAWMLVGAQDSLRKCR